MILFGQTEIIILRGRGRRQPRQGVAIVPRHPFRRVLLQLFGMPQQFREVIKCIDIVELALSKDYAGALPV
jgi:hypothetical protein